ncbi:hypothetical protein [Pseudobythopirellula maris]|uniref:hypothetical protein n=1 Tax=Pseudobythopirellula maris TaxID=2527991 RepID=UPI0011B76AD6|nr:hypothetical protein [Pseudobythopirellula maris]
MPWLEDLRKQADNATRRQDWPQVQFLGATCTVAPYGIGSKLTGFGVKQEFPYRLDSADFQLFLPAVHTPGGAVAKWECHAESSIRLRSPVPSINSAKSVLEQIGVTPRGERIGRIDAAIDFAKPITRPLFALHTGGHRAGYIKGEQQYDHGRGLSFYAGKKSGADKVLMRCYEKTAQLKAVVKREGERLRKLEQLQERLGVETDTIDRIEWQIGGRWAREKYEGTETVEGLVAALPTIVRDLQSKGYRLTERPASGAYVDRKNRHKLGTHPLWELVQRAAEAVDWEGSLMGRVEVARARREPVPLTQRENRDRAIYAYLRFIALLPGISFEDEIDARAAMIADLQSTTLPEDWKDRIEAERLKYGDLAALERIGVGAPDERAGWGEVRYRPLPGSVMQPAHRAIAEYQSRLLADDDNTSVLDNVVCNSRSS